MSETLMVEILKRLDLLAGKLGEGSEFAWAAYMRQAIVVDGWLQIFVGVVLLLTNIGAVKFAFWICRPAPETAEEEAQRVRYSRRRDFAIEDDTGRWFGVAMVCTVVVVVSIFGMASLWDGVQHVINPQYYALMNLARMLGK